jgi:hypothetical protein
MDFNFEDEIPIRWVECNDPDFVRLFVVLYKLDKNDILEIL